MSHLPSQPPEIIAETLSQSPGSAGSAWVREKRWRLASSFLNQHRVVVAGLHFVQEDSPDEIGQAIARWLERI